MNNNKTLKKAAHGIDNQENIEENVSQIPNDVFELEITDEINLENLKRYNLPIIIDFGSDGCMPCRQMAPDLKELNKQMIGKAIVKFADVWEYTNLADGYPVVLIPTQIFINSDGTPYSPQNAEELDLEFITNENGEHIFTRHVGGLSLEQMKSMLKEMGLNE